MFSKIIVHITQIRTVFKLRKKWVVLDKAGLVESDLCHGKNDLKLLLYSIVCL